MQPEKALAKSQPTPPVLAMLQKMAEPMAKALPRHISPDRMLRICTTAIRQNSDLLRCDPASVIGAIMTSAQLGLEPNTPLGLAYLIPYGQNCQFIVGYQGYMELARRSGLVGSIYAYAVREGDAFEVEYGLTPSLRHKPSNALDREDKPLTHVYAVAHLKDGSPPTFIVLTKGEVDKFRARSKAGNSGPWKTDYDAMALKTAIRRLWKWLPKTAEMQRAAEAEDAADRGSQSEAWETATVEAIQGVGLKVPEATDVLAEARESDPEAPPEPSKGEKVLSRAKGAEA